ncbi:MAG: ABC transporter permease [Symbiobacteriaceae bacterium]|nr:ABC transporter permease [Symbiobacteriaceae bacterium]
MNRWRQLLASSAVTSFISSLMAIVVGLAAGFIVMLISNSSQAVRAFWVILSSGVADMRNIGQVLYFATPIIMTGLAVGFASRTGLFNIGASGQFTVGAFLAILVSIRSLALPGPLPWILGLSAATLGGALWGLIPGVLKAWRNVNEVIAGIMTNYIGMYLVNFLITRTVYDRLRNQTLRVPPRGTIPKMGFEHIFRVGNSVSSVNGGIVIAAVTAILLYILLEKTTFGYELKACGLNRDAARYAGINENRSIILSMMISGALAGLGGGLLYLAGAGKSLDVVDVLAPEGFNGIPVALLGMNSPLGIVLAGLFIAYLTVGGFNMQLFRFAPQVIEIITAVIIYFSAFALLFKNFLEGRLVPGRLLEREEEGEPTAERGGGS